MSTNNSTGTPDISGNNTSQVSATNNKVILNVSNNTMSSNITANSNNNQNLNTSNLPKTIIHTGVKLNAFSPISASNNLSPSKVASIQSPIALLSNQSINTSQTTNIITTTAPINTSNTSTTNNNNSSSGGTGSNNANNSNNANTNSYGGFAHCSNCGEIGVKDAFYGKSKLYCSVACQSGIKKQQQSQGTKRTIDSLNYSSCSSVNNSPVLQAPQLVNLPTSSQNIVKSSAPLQQIQTNSTNQSAALYQNNESNLNSSLVPTVISTLNKNEYITMNKSSNQVTNQLNSNLNTKLIYQENECLTSTSTLSSHTTSSSMHNGNASKRARNGSNVSATSTIKNLTDQQNLLSIQKINDDENKKTDSKASANFDSEKSLSPQKKHFDWPSYLEKGNFEAAPVKLFKHAPIHSFLKKVSTKLIVEAPYSDPKQSDSIQNSETYWFATAIQYAGYLVKLRYVGYEEDSKDFWMHICDPNLHGMGWASNNGAILVPPNEVIEKYDKFDLIDFLHKSLIGDKTLPKNFQKKVEESLETKFSKGMLLELIDKKELSSMTTARVTNNIGGRLEMRYDNDETNSYFWCHEKSDLIHPIGWSSHVGHRIQATEDYKRKSCIKYEHTMNNNSKNVYEADECSPNMFKNSNFKSETDVIRNLKPFKVGMKLEAIDPYYPSSLCVATVQNILKDDYLMIRIDGYNENEGDICYHRTSSSIFPAGFCQKNSLRLRKPIDYKKAFNWKKYLSETNSEFAPNELFFQHDTENPFKVGMKLESVDLPNPNLICVATVVAIVDRLLRIHFDGWEKQYDQWVDFESSDIYPIGWCELVKYELQPPPASQKKRRSTR